MLEWKGLTEEEKKCVICKDLKKQKSGFPVEMYKVLRWYPNCDSQHMMNRSTGKLRDLLLRGRKNVQDIFQTDTGDKYKH